MSPLAYSKIIVLYISQEALVVVFFFCMKKYNSTQEIKFRWIWFWRLLEWVISISLNFDYKAFETILFDFIFQQFIIYLQEYISSKQANQVRSLMYMIDMLMTETLSKEDANENKHIKNYSMVNWLLFYFFLSEKEYL